MPGLTKRLFGTLRFGRGPAKGLVARQERRERALLNGSVLLVAVVELINSAIETTVDRVGKEHHELSGRAKDLASSAVFASILLAVIVWLVLLLG